MTADCIDVVNVVDESTVTDRMGFVFEFGQTGSPDYTNAADSGNDVAALGGRYAVYRRRVWMKNATSTSIFNLTSPPPPPPPPSRLTTSFAAGSSSTT